MHLLRFALVVAIFVTINVLLIVAPQSEAAARVSGEAYGLAVGSPPVAAPGAAWVQLPPEGGRVADTSSGAGFGLGNGDASTTQIDTSAVGDPGPGTVTSTVAMADGELLGGVVRVRDVRVTVSTNAGGGRAGSTATITFGTLIVAGVSYPNPSINQRIDVPGVGTVIVNEQIIGGNGTDTASVVANAVHMQITATSVMDLPRGTELILAHAAAGVPDIVASRAVAAAPTATATDVPWSPITPYRPVDVSLNENFDNGNDNFDVNENSNDNGGGGGAATATPTRPPATPATPIGIVITVIVVEGTPTPTPTPSLTPAATSTFTPTATLTPTRTPTP